MDNKNETQKQNIFWIVQALLLFILCFLMFLQNKKLERLMFLGMRKSYDPYEVHLYDRKSSNDFILMEKNINKRFMEFAREIDEMRYIVDSIFNKNNIASYNNYEEEIEKLHKQNKVNKNKIKNNIHENIDNPVNKKNKTKHISKKVHQFNLKTNYDKKDKEYKVELDLPDGFTLDDIQVSLENSILTLNIQKEQREGDNGEVIIYDSFYQSFTIPKTKSKMKDIEKKLDDNKLEIKIPIK